MRPILFEIYGYAIPAWHFFFALAGLVSFFYCDKLFASSVQNEALAASRAALPQVFILCYVFGWLGARALSIVVEQFEVDSISEFATALFSFGPMTFYGGAIASFFAGLIYLLLRKKPVRVFADAALPAGVLGLGIGRIGCFFNGDDFGLPVTNQIHPPWWSVEFPNLGDGLARYPVQLQEALVSVVIAGVAWIAFQRNHAGVRQRFPSGLIGCLATLVSAANRFFNESYRADARGTFFSTSLSTSQGIALILLFSAMVVGARLMRTWEECE